MQFGCGSVSSLLFCGHPGFFQIFRINFRTNYSFETGLSSKLFYVLFYLKSSEMFHSSLLKNWSSL